jgi:NADPH-dependent ferric siderophore reductase
MAVAATSARPTTQATAPARRAGPPRGGVPAEALRVPFRFADARVVRTQPLSPTMLRITFGPGAPGGFDHLDCGGLDQRVKLLFPHPGQTEPVVPVDAGDEWLAAWRAMDPDVRAVMRSYTVRAQRRAPAEVDVDFALHGDVGFASAWALRASPGDRVTLLGPVAADNGGVDFRPPAGTDGVVLFGDETALPAVAGVLEALPAGTPVRAWVEVPDAADVTDLPTVADAEITWLVRAHDRRPRADVALGALRTTDLPGTAPYAWVAGEAGTVKALRRHLVRERGLPKEHVTFTGYWRLGATDDQRVAETLAGRPDVR